MVDPSSTTQRALALPPETWLAILNELGYYDLKRIARTSRAFKDLLDAPGLDGALFRGAPTGAKVPPDTRIITRHPLLNVERCAEFHRGECPLQISARPRPEPGVDVDVGEDDSSPLLTRRTWSILDLAASQEFATSPSTTTLKLINRSCDEIIKNSQGVTVADVLNQVNRSRPACWTKGFRRWTIAVDGDGQVILKGNWVREEWGFGVFGARF
ncbi:hypothetical protein P7C70_g8950, partial [Phenoliferia sp. Uapishka_3]